MRLFKQLFAVLALLCATYAHAESVGGRDYKVPSPPPDSSGKEVVAGRDYKVLNPPQPTSSGNRVEVLEFFFYECSHCYHLYGPLSAWEKQKPRDVSLQFVPVIFRDSAEPMARTFYALEALGQSARLHKDLFEAWHLFNIDLSDEAKITDFVAKHGVDRAKFGAAYNSFSMSSKVARSYRMVENYGVRGTPTITVDGKYLISNLQPEDTIRVLDEVIRLARKERNKR